MTRKEIQDKLQEAAKLLKKATTSICSTDAFLLISKFESEACLLSVLYFTQDESIHLFLKARVLGFEGDGVLTLVAGDQNFCIVFLDGCRYEYYDETFVPESLRNIERVEGTLTIIFPSHERLTLKALRDEAASNP